MKTVVYKVVIPADRQLCLPVPEDIPPGPAEVVLIIAPQAPGKKDMTAGDWLRSPLCGIWKDRRDISDSVEFARSLRVKAEQRARA